MDDWLKSEDPNLQAIAFNIMYDHRVSKEREQAFDAFCKHPCTGVELNEAILNYFYKAVRHTTSPHFASRAINRSNILSDFDSSPSLIYKFRGWIEIIRSKFSIRQKQKSATLLEAFPRIQKPKLQFDKETDLARIIDLNGLGDVFQSAKDARMAEFERYPGNEKISEWLDDILGYSEDKTSLFISATLRAINRHFRVSPFHPTWATLWAQFEPHTSEEADRWLELLGMHKNEARRWLIVLKYRVGKAVTVAHPTQLDAGWWPFYFPSPPKAPLGHPMNLEYPLPIPTLLSELIHTQTKHSIAHWNNAGRLCKVTTQATHRELPFQRKNHYLQLKNIYGEQDVEEWMPYHSQFEAG